MTPEGRVKRRVKTVLDSFGPLVFYRMPVLNGMGKPGLDFYGCCAGRHFEIETKASGKALTQRQRITAGEVEAAGGAFFAIMSVDDPELNRLKHWLKVTLLC